MSGNPVAVAFIVMHKPNAISLRRIRTRMTRASWSARLLAAWVVLSLIFALTPCCEVIGAASAAAPASASTDRSSHTPDTGDPCATWLDRSDAVTPKTDVVAPPVAKVVLTIPLVLFPNASLTAAIWRPFHLSASQPDALYLRYARLIL